jgi:hypothetical protein
MGQGSESPVVARRINTIVNRRTPSRIMGITLFGTHNPLVPGANPGGPSNTQRHDGRILAQPATSLKAVRIALNLQLVEQIKLNRVGGPCRRA